MAPPFPAGRLHEEGKADFARVDGNCSKECHRWSNLFRGHFCRYPKIQPVEGRSGRVSDVGGELKRTLVHPPKVAWVSALLKTGAG